LTNIVFALFPFTTSFMSITIVALLIGIASGFDRGTTGTVAAGLAPDKPFLAFYLGYLELKRLILDFMKKCLGFFQFDRSA